MATVYLAEDLRHHRKVALKVLRPDLAAVLGAERFVQEITTTASLQHPHILPLFDSGAVGGSASPDDEAGSPSRRAAAYLYYVMPYVEGETLRSKLDRETQLGIEEAVRITTEVADALDYAHRHGVIHRDIKPENILLHDGRPMVADFGIALALSAAAGGRMTETGLSLGTPHYMSPEQATAEKELTNRSDIYSLGIVLYEMLTGNPPHVGASAQQIIMKIVTEEAAPVTSLRKSVPPNVAAAVAKAIQKLPADRFETARTFAEALNNPAFSLMAAGAAGSAGVPVTLSTAARWKWGGMAAGVLGVGLLVGLMLGRSRPVSPDVARFTLPTGAAFRLAVNASQDPPFAISPDGRTIVLAGEDSTRRSTWLYQRPIDRLEATLIPGTEGAAAPFFSPDGLWIGFVTPGDHKIRKVPVAGGPAITLANNSLRFYGGATWGDDGAIVYESTEYGLSRVSGNGGPSESIADTAGVGTGISWPQVLPGGRAVLAVVCHEFCESHELALLDLKTRKFKTLVEGAGRGWYLPTGHLIYMTEGALYGVRFDLKRLAVVGAAIPLLDKIEGTAAAGARFAVSAAGTVAYLSGVSAADRVVALVDRRGHEDVVISRHGEYARPRLSPNGDRIALSIPVRNQSQIWVYDIPSATLSQVTFEGTNDRPSWSPDGTRLVFTSLRDSRWDIWWAPADGSGPPERVVEGPDVTIVSTTSWSRDGKWILFDGPAEGDSTAGANQDVFAVPTTGQRTRQVAVGTPAIEEAGELSPDGRWIAYNSSESGITQIYVRPFLRPGARGLISTGAGIEPVWISNQELAYHDRDNDSLTIATLDLGATIRVRQRTNVFDYSRYRMGTVSWRSYDVSRDGKRFLVIREAAPPEAHDPIVVLNWFEEVRRRFAEQGVSR